MNKTFFALLVLGGLWGCSDDESDGDGAAGSAGSAGAPSAMPFGAACETADDCTAPTNYCAAPPMQTKFCTQTMDSCDEAPTTCPEGWTCLDLNMFEIPAPRRAEVEQEQARLRERVALLWVSADAPGAKLFINEEPVATLPLQGLVPLNPGIIRVRVEADGRKSYIGELNVAGGDRPRLELALEVQQVVAAGPREPEIDYTPVWISGIAAGALGIGAITFAVVTSKANSDLDEQLDTFPGNESELDDQRSKVKTFAGLTDAFAIGTVVAAGVGAYYLIFPNYVSEEHPEQGEGVRVSAGLGGIIIDGTF